MPKSTTDVICGRSWSMTFTSGVIMEKSPFAMVATRRGPRESKSMSGRVFPWHLFFGDFTLKRDENRFTFGVLFRDNHGDLQHFGNLEHLVDRQYQLINAEYEISVFARRNGRIQSLLAQAWKLQAW